MARPSSLLLLLCACASRASARASFAPPRGIERRRNRDALRRGARGRFSAVVPTGEDVAPKPSSTVAVATASLPELYPRFAETLSSNGYATPTPIQRSSSPPARDGESLLLIAATGSGKTLAYLLPALSRAAGGMERGGRRTTLIVAPTRELAAQLARDASLLLPDEAGDGAPLPDVLLAVRSIPPPTSAQMARAKVLVGTPDELHTVLTRIRGAQAFLAGDTLSGLILDEVDVLLPPAPKTLRTTFDGNAARRERKTLEQKRKLRAAQRRGVEFHGGSDMKGKSIDSMDLSNSMNGQVLTPTERVLRLIASARYVGGGEEDDGDDPALQVLAGSATASRATLDRLNKALRWAAAEGGVIGGGDGPPEGVWKGRMKVCRPEAKSGAADADEPEADDATHTIRAVTVPSAVDHRYVRMTKDQMTNSREVLANVARVAEKLKPETSLVFICGEFSRTVLKDKKREAPKASGNTSKARRNAKRRSVFIEKQRSGDGSARKGSGGPEPLSVRGACSTLRSMGVDARPMHVVLGLEPNASGEEGGATAPGEGEDAGADGDDDVELPPVLVTFEGSARGLHFEGVDVVFVVGRPTSAASYLHLAGRVGRATASSSSSDGGDAAEAGAGEVDVRPGTVVSFCSGGRLAELEKWTGQVGATGLEEIEL